MASRTAPATISRQKRIRKIFGDIHEVIDMPNLIEVQRESYEQLILDRKNAAQRLFEARYITDRRVGTQKLFIAFALDFDIASKAYP